MTGYNYSHAKGLRKELLTQHEKAYRLRLLMSVTWFLENVAVICFLGKVRHLPRVALAFVVP